MDHFLAPINGRTNVFLSMADALDCHAVPTKNAGSICSHRGCRRPMKKQIAPAKPRALPICPFFKLKLPTFRCEETNSNAILCMSLKDNLPSFVCKYTNNLGTKSLKTHVSENTNGMMHQYIQMLRDALYL